MKRAIIFAAFAAMAASFASAQAPVAMLKTVTGKVEIKAPGKDWMPAKAGTAITKDTAISTGFKSVAIVTLGDSTLTVKPLTRLTLQEIVQQEGSEKVKLYLLAGRVRAEVKPPAGGKTDFSVKSPTATASVRGTQFTFNGWNLDVSEGGVRFTSPDGHEYLVSRGESSFLDKDGNPQDPAELAEELSELPLPAGMDAEAVMSLLDSLGQSGVKRGSVSVTVGW
jgi:hypothetical protein